MPSSLDIFQLKIRLLGISPMIWRRVLVCSSTSLRELHGIFQVAMGWDSIHLFRFEIRAVDYRSWELHAASPDISLTDFGFRGNDRFFYIYDMGDYWKHEVRVEVIVAADPKKPYPICTGGAGVCLPEECGGPQGYLARRDEAGGYEAWTDMGVMTEFLEDIVDTDDADRLVRDFMSDDVEAAMLRMVARKPFLDGKFSRGALNKRLRAGAHSDGSGHPFQRHPDGHSGLSGQADTSPLSLGF